MNTLRFTAPVEIHAAADGKKVRRFSALVYTGGALNLMGSYRLPIVTNLATLRLSPQMRANLDHDSTKRVGEVDNVVNDKRTLTLEGKANAASPARDEVLASADEGYQWRASIEVNEFNLVEVPKGKSVTVNGQSFTGPIYVAEQGLLMGFAFVSQGADHHTAVSIAASKGNGMSTSFQARAASMIHGFDEATANPELVATLKANYAGQHFTPPANSLEEFDADPIKMEENRVSLIRGIKLPEAGEARAACEQVIEASIAGGKTVRETKLEVVQASRTSIPMAHTVRAGRNSMSKEVIEAAFCQSIDLPNIEKHYSDQVLQAAHDQFRGNVSLQQVILSGAASSGYHCLPGERIHDGNLRRLLAHVCPSPHDEIRASWSTISVPGILSNVANKALLEGYMEESGEWREISTIKSVQNFKEATHYRLLDSSEYEELGAAGEIKHGTLGEENYTTQAKTYAKMFSLTRHDIINDDLSAFDKLRVQLGRGSAQKFRKVFWTRFVNNSTFFTTGRTNYIEGATTNLGTDYVGLQLGIDAFRNLRTPAADGAKKIGGQPVLLLVPPELETTALRLYSPLAAAELTEINPWAGKFKPIIIDELSDSSYTGYSTTAWYLFRAANMGAPMAVSFLNGQQTPTVETAEADFHVLGMSFRGYHDFGCDFAEPLAGIKSKGAA